MPKRDPKTFSGEKGRAPRTSGMGPRCPICHDVYQTDVGMRRHTVRKHGHRWHVDGSTSPLSPAQLQESERKLKIQQMNSKQRARYEAHLRASVIESAEGSGNGIPSNSGCGAIGGESLPNPVIQPGPASKCSAGADCGGQRYRGPSSSSVLELDLDSSGTTGVVDAPSFFDELQLDAMGGPELEFPDLGLIRGAASLSRGPLDQWGVMPDPPALGREQSAQTDSVQRKMIGVQASTVFSGLRPPPAGFTYSEISERVFQWSGQATGEIVSRMLIEASRDISEDDRSQLETIVESMIVGVRTFARGLQLRYAEIASSWDPSVGRTVIEGLVNDAAQRNFQDVESVYQLPVYLDVYGSPVVTDASDEEDSITDDIYISSDSETWDPRDDHPEADSYL